ncbi:MarR family transcriptional regulator [Streptomyces sp. NPDC026672]|uniref:MarR family winged helix-turn-helix transcriptional regulator n=1 Tax=unclassified Streptomyces TaxID=2593676 RepID=UPI0033D54B98
MTDLSARRRSTHSADAAPSTPADAPAPTPAELMEQFAQAASDYYRTFGVVAAEQGLTFMQGKMLSLLRRPMSMRGLAELMGCDASNVTGIVDRLEARDLVRRETDQNDRRIKNVAVTEQGTEVIRLIRADLMSGMTALEQLDPAQRQAFHDLLAQVFPKNGI